MIRTRVLATAVGISALFSASFAAAAPTEKPTGEQFMKEAIQGNLAEVKVGQLAQEKGSTQEVKDLGAMLAKDHEAANQSAIQAAQKMSVTVPNAPSNKQQATYEKLSRLSGEQFDRAFLQDSLKDHKHDIALYKHESQQGNSPSASYAQETLPKLEEHLKMTESAQRSEHVASASDGSKMK